ncbi:hypothetical protein SAMN05660473_02022 [Arthrobacter sp. 49Tsu3.1M3]|nr:hypothetical protein SAMN05660473_02022 [Arthrobacter sp. 49Tsu3.1M3]
MTPPQAATQATSPISHASSTEAKSSWKMKKITTAREKTPTNRFNLRLLMEMSSACVATEKV